MIPPDGAEHIPAGKWREHRFSRGFSENEEMLPHMKVFLWRVVRTFMFIISNASALYFMKAIY